LFDDASAWARRVWLLSIGNREVEAATNAAAGD
jgi:hypothetical protein